MIAVAVTAPLWYFAWAAATLTLMAVLIVALLIGLVILSGRRFSPPAIAIVVEGRDQVPQHEDRSRRLPCTARPTRQV